MPPCPAEDTCWLYLIRHGATANNVAVPPRLQGRRSDPPLSTEGCEQARRTAEALASAGLARVISSPLQRARQTAEAVAAPHGIEVEIDDALIEIDVGAWEGWTWEDVARTHPEAYAAFHTDAAVHPYLEGENMQTVFARCAPSLEQWMQQNLGRVIAVVAHNVVNRCYLASRMGIALSRYRSIPQDNCGISLVRYRGGAAKVVTINSVEHLRQC
ncbi:MAG: histidine phosphatase family protein [Planctomycetota bacterium]